MPAPKTWTTERKEKLTELVEEDYPYATIAAILDCSVNAVSKQVGKLGLKRNPYKNYTNRASGRFAQLYPY